IADSLSVTGATSYEVAPWVTQYVACVGSGEGSPRDVGGGGGAKGAVFGGGAELGLVPGVVHVEHVGTEELSQGERHGERARVERELRMLEAVDGDEDDHEDAVPARRRVAPPPPA